MKKSRYTEQQIAFVLKQSEDGISGEEIMRKMGISEATFYNWKKKYGGLDISEQSYQFMLNAMKCKFSYYEFLPSIGDHYYGQLLRTKIIYGKFYLSKLLNRAVETANKEKLCLIQNIFVKSCTQQLAS